MKLGTLVKVGLVTSIGILAAEEPGSTGVWIVGRRTPDEPLRTGKVWPQSPADKAGIKPGCYLIAIDGTNVVHLPITNAVNLVRGPIGKIVTLEIADPARTKTNKFVVKRGKAVIQNNQVINVTGE